MYKFLTKNGQTLAFGLGVLITVIFLISVVSNMGEFTAMAEEKQMETTIFDFGLYGAMALAVIAAAAMVIFGLAQVVTSFKSSMKGILGFVALLVVFFVSYSMTDTDISPYIQGAIDKFEQGGAEFTEGNLKFISGGISTTIVLVVVAAAAFVVSEITNLFK
ncbi:hypothetical protein [Phaeodactylibacter xiamenensis]|jgi:hypothetical protein|uniref:Uncharacterized protein n=1 Tax=Phaeodactylibacter xiamenensis TaxID=1524460 RepID=A0A098SER1_9BACT|nr:hypothetical protein [Phaeodactylibacter xiamenensis]KGE89432.1 hypothetical protein IX84_03740 [Phaeodactylibacter xiamenensis]MCR9054403.1 hypothetical protein [bacterium]